MIFKLRTSNETMKIYNELGSILRLQPYILCKLSIALSIKLNKKLETEDFLTNNDGLELNRQTITGEYDDLFKALVIQHAEKKLSDDEYFPKYVKAHIDRGAKLLLSEYRYGKKKFYEHMIDINKSI